MTESDQMRILWLFFFQHYDDWVMNPDGDVSKIFITSRVARVLENVFDEKLFENALKKWKEEGSIAILGTACGPSEQPYIQILDYVSEIKQDGN